MANIRVLSQNLVNMIAAGEVIERPASVVKELMENSLDAAASRIDVSLEDGGRRMVRVTDDGRGMSGEDLSLAFAPHATSKISSADDLYGIATLGFRGEALASVASVSRVRGRTGTRGAPGGWEISAAGGKIEPVKPAPASAGTTITIRDLFFNTPARRKFMRTANTEFAHCSEVFARLAMAHPQVAFTLTHNDRKVHNLPVANTTRRRVADLYGNELGEQLIAFRRASGGMQVAGLIGRPDSAKASSKWQYFFLNARYVRDRMLSHALREAYRGLIDPQRWPVAFIFIEIEPREVDVNVHPTKTEVRFENGQKVHGELLSALREALNKASLTPNVSIQDHPAERAGPSDATYVSDEPTDDVREPQASPRPGSVGIRQALADFLKSVPPHQPRLDFARGRPSDQADAAHFVHRPGKTHAPAQGPQVRAPKEQYEPLEGGEIMQIHNSYIVAASEEGLLIIDQHALHERLIYNDLQRRLADEQSKGLPGQHLLIPVRIEASPGQIAAAQSGRQLLDKLGIEVRSFGPNALAVQRFPVMLAERGIEPGEFVSDLLDIISQEQSTSRENILEDIIEMMACKAAVKAGQRLTREEMRELLDRCPEAQKGSSCPHGRPTVLKLTLDDLRKQFKRT